MPLAGFLVNSRDVTERRRFEDLAEYLLQSARDELGGAAISVINDLVKPASVIASPTFWRASPA